jgi:uncharacterized protein (DUF427 family)
MPGQITVTPSNATWVVHTEGAILAETRRALELREGPYRPIGPSPTSSARTSRWSSSSGPPRRPPARTSHASYFSFVGPKGTTYDAA